MSTFNSAEAACVKVRGLLDSYVAGETGETRTDVRGHLETCDACNALARERERLRALVRRAVRRERAPESLKARVRAMIRANAE